MSLESREFYSGLSATTREYREKLLSDPYRPTYHFAVPDSNAQSGDPNGAFYADGVYHLMYLYLHPKNNGWHWGHISSVDLIHWRHHKDALTVSDDDNGCYSGGAFVDDDKTAYLAFWKWPSKDESGDKGGMALAYSKPPYEDWIKMDNIAVENNNEKWGILDIEINGKLEHIACADPSNIWKKDGWYYMQAGNKPVLSEYGNAEVPDPYYQGDWTSLFRSKDLKNWEYVHRFYTNPHTDASWPDLTEDDMCPSFFPLYDAKENGKETGKWMQVFISHNKGCQYYIGTLEGEKFIPETHGRMTWNDRTYFAPEELIDGKNRRIIWTWLLGWMYEHLDYDFDEHGWNGTLSFPRCLWLQDGQLRMAPIDELDLLQYNKQTPEISDDNSFKPGNGELFRIKAEFDIKNQDKAGFSVRISSDKKQHADIYYDKEKQLLVFDTSSIGKYGWKIKEEAPLVLEDGENLCLDIFADKSIIEVYANEKQAICRRLYPENPADAVSGALIGDKNSLINFNVWEMAPANAY